jgi:BON domain
MVEFQERVLNELYFECAIPRDRLTVRFQNRHVTLSGEVEWPYQKSCAEAAVRRVPGVTGIANEIAVLRTVARDCAQPRQGFLTEIARYYAHAEPGFARR